MYLILGMMSHHLTSYCPAISAPICRDSDCSGLAPNLPFKSIYKESAWGEFCQCREDACAELQRESLG
eukprot:XP_001705582.1 Hypothetical protein GL50803_38222 [Giardia lamblia ATCC 50803]